MSSSGVDLQHRGKHLAGDQSLVRSQLVDDRIAGRDVLGGVDDDRRHRHVTDQLQEIGRRAGALRRGTPRSPATRWRRSRARRPSAAGSMRGVSAGRGAGVFGGAHGQPLKRPARPPSGPPGLSPPLLQIRIRSTVTTGRPASRAARDCGRRRLRCRTHHCDHQRNIGVAAEESCATTVAGDGAVDTENRLRLR